MSVKNCLAGAMVILALAGFATAAEVGFNWNSPGDRFSGYGWEAPQRLGGPSPMASNADETDDSTGYDVTHYNVEIQFFIPTHGVAGKVDMHFTATSASLSEVNLNLSNNMVVDSAKVNGALVAHQFFGADELRFNLSAALNQGDTATVTTWYHGIPQGGADFSGLFFEYQPQTITPVIFSLSEPEGARRWWPCKDIPSEKATARMLWTVPDWMYATSNGLLQSITRPQPGWKSYEWAENIPINSYLICVTATNFAHLRDWYVSATGDSMPLDNYVYPADSVDAIISFSNLAAQIGYFASLFGEYPFITEKYGHAAFNFGGAMEHQTLTSYYWGAIDGTHNWDWMMAHELSHQWWGDLITCETWADIWLNEGFATYCDALWAYHAGGEPAYQQRMYNFRQNYFYFDSHSGRFQIYNPPPELMWGATSYEKGALVLNMLRNVIGETNFWNFWHVYRDAYAPGNAPGNVNTAQMIQTAQQVSGMDLGWFFNEWVYQAGYPEYHWGWLAETNWDCTGVVLSIQQMQSTAFQTPEVFTMPVPIRVVSDSGTFDFVAQNDQRTQNFIFTVPGLAGAVQFDPDSVILKTAVQVPYVGVIPAPQVQPYTQTLLKLGPNPANPTTVASFELRVPSHVRLTVWDTAGRLVTTLLEGQKQAGEYSVPFDGLQLASGMYLVRLETEREQLTQKLVLLK